MTGVRSTLIGDWRTAQPATFARSTQAAYRIQPIYVACLAFLQARVWKGTE